MFTKKIGVSIALVAGIVIGIIGIGLMGVYVFSAVIANVGKPDQSLLFWYLPILFIGVFGLIVGTSISMLSFLSLKKHNH